MSFDNPPPMFVLPRKQLVRQYRDHLKTSNVNQTLVKEKMDTFLKKTFKSNLVRDTTFDNASRELER